MVRPVRLVNRVNRVSKVPLVQRALQVIPDSQVQREQ